MPDKLTIIEILFYWYNILRLKYLNIKIYTTCALLNGRVYLPRHGEHKARKVCWITRDGANNS